LKISAFDGQKITWAAKPYELYEILNSTNLNNWSVWKPVVPTNTPATVFVATNLARVFFRVTKVP